MVKYNMVDIDTKTLYQQDNFTSGCWAQYNARRLIIELDWYRHSLAVF